MNKLQLIVVLTGLVMSSILMVFPQIQYARANYPRSRRWLLYRFGSSFLGGLLLGLLLFYWDYGGIQLLAWIMLPGLVSGIFLTFIFPYNMRRVIPKRDTPDDDQT